MYEYVMNLVTGADSPVTFGLKIHFWGGIHEEWVWVSNGTRNCAFSANFYLKV